MLLVNRFHLINWGGGRFGKSWLEGEGSVGLEPCTKYIDDGL